VCARYGKRRVVKVGGWREREGEVEKGREGENGGGGGGRQFSIR